MGNAQFQQMLEGALDEVNKKAAEKALKTAGYSKSDDNAAEPPRLEIPDELLNKEVRVFLYFS